MKKYLLFLSIFVFLHCYSQPSITWQKSLGGTGSEDATAIALTADGGYIVAGSSDSNDGDVTGNHGGFDYWVAKLANTGSIEWQKSLGGAGNESPSAIQQTTDGGYIISGSSNSNDGNVTGNHGGYDCWIVKLTSEGIIEWQKSFGGTLRDYASSILQTTDGGYIIAGQSNSNDGDVAGNHGGADCWIVKLNSTGVVEWQKSLGGTLDETACSIQQMTDGGYIIAGDSNSNDKDVAGNYGSFDIWVAKLTNTGVIVWQKSLGGTAFDGTYSVLQTTDEGYIIGGYSASNNGNVTGNHGDFDYWVIKLTNMGIIEWQKSFGGTGVDQAYSIQQTSDEGYVVAGFSNSKDGDVAGNHGDFDYWVVKLTTTGSIEWQKSFGGAATDKITAIKRATDGGYVIAGLSYSKNGDVTGNHGSSDFWIVKLNNLLSTGETTIENMFSVYPNPASEEIHVNTKENALGLPYFIYDHLGRSVLKGKLNGYNSIIEIDNLSKGIYILSIGDKIKTNRKIVKE